MRKMITSTIGALIVVWTTSAASAAVLVTGSTFGVYLQQTDATTDTTVRSARYTLVAGAAPQAFTFGTATGTIAQNETDLGGGSYRLLFTINAGADLFPAVGTDRIYGLMGVGVIDRLDLTAPFAVTATQLTFLDGNGSVLASTSAPPSNADPFDGAYPSVGVVQGFVPIGGQNTRTITLSLTGNFIGAAVPEPATWAMMVAGFGLAGATMRRRRAAVRFA